MISLDGISHIYLAPGYTDMRKSADGLSALVKYSMFLDPCSRDLFVFCNRRKTTVKILEWDGTGFWTHTKKLIGKNRFQWPKNSEESSSVIIDERQLKWLFEGLELYPKHVNREVIPAISNG